MKVRSFAAIMAAVCLLAVVFTAGAQAAKSPYVIGALFDVTGPGSPLGTPERDTVKMIESMVNKTGGINGHPVRFVFADNASEEVKSAMAATKMVNSDKVKVIIGTSTTGTTLAITSICERAHIPLVSCAASAKITSPVKPFVFKTAQSDVYAIAKALDYLKSKHITRIAFLNDSNAFGKSGLDQVRLQAPAAKISIVSQESFDSKDTDMTTQLTRIKSSRPQALVCWGTNPGPAIVAKNAKQLGMNIPIIMSHGISNRKFIELAGPAANGVVFPSGRIIVANAIANSDRQKKTLLQYEGMFKKTYGRDADHFGGHAWDATWLVLNAMKKVGDDPMKIRAEIEKTKNFVGIGGVFNFSPQEHNGLRKDAFVMVQIKNEKWTLLK